MAQKPDGKSGNLQKVQFTRPAAERIARVVRQVELGNRDTAPLRFAPRLRQAAGSKDIFRMARFAGSWEVDSTTTITFTNPIHSNATATAINYFCGIADGDIGVCKDSTGVWHLVSWEMTEVCTTRLIDMQLQLNTASCEIIKTLVTATHRFMKLTYPFATCSTATTPG
ncbi:MAG: hypothetical protein ACO3IT_09285 [Ilumatobacteraceae bacterium]